MVHLQRAVKMSRFGDWKKILVFHRQPYSRYHYYISRMLRYHKKQGLYNFFIFFFQPRALFQTFIVSER